MAQVGDLVLAYMEGSPAFFARIEGIAPDVKPEWFQLKLLVLQVPLLVITWILREEYINGQEFTMGGRPVRLEKVISPERTGEEAPAGISPGPEEPSPAEDAQKDSGPAPQRPPGKGKVVSFMDRKKKDQPS
ncbi:MAG: hypothetical protein GX433_03325 [Deltaproteobacteria bacterium]|nr:hypothetical protein [Deltaproteobacteria bacterium]